METKIEIRIIKVFAAGISELHVTDVCGSPDVILSLNPGAPFNLVLQDGERLAMAINCDLYVDDELRREKITD